MSSFNQYVDGYDSAIDDAVSFSGEDGSYFAQRRIQWLTDKLRRLNVSPRTVLDFGCGVGRSISHLSQLIEPRLIVGVDVSDKSIDRARQTCPESAQFTVLSEYRPSQAFDLVFSNGVFHHIPPSERGAALGLIKESLRPGGIFAFWENNPLNPGTRIVMARLPFDKDAVTISPWEARRMLTAAGFEIQDVSFLFIFPRMLKVLRRLEPLFSRLPIGGQYQILGRRRLS
jgi:trans-aconitate methyltransferase